MDLKASGQTSCKDTQRFKVKNMDRDNLSKEGTRQKSEHLSGQEALDKVFTRKPITFGNFIIIICLITTF